RRCRRRASARNGGNVSARDEIIAALEAAAPAPLERPDLSRFAPPREGNLREKFEKSVIEVGGRLANALEEIPEYKTARKWASLLPGLAGNVDLGAIHDPHELNDLDFCVIPAVLGVAENGACWIVEHGGRSEER